MSVLAAIRPDSWNFPLFLHVLGAMVLVGAATTGVFAELVAPATPEPARMRRFAFRTLLFVGVPAYIAMRGGAAWIYSKEFTGSGDDDPTWVGIGFITAEGGGLLFLIALVLAGVASWKSKSGLGKAAGILAGICVLAWFVAVWAMGAKPG